MNIGSMHSDEDDFYLPLWPTSSTTLSASSFTSHDQSGNSGTIGLFNELITSDSSFQTLDAPSLPMHSQYYSTTAEVHAEDINFLKNVNSELDPQLPMPELSDEYPSLWPEVPPTLRQYYTQEMPNENPQEIQPEFPLSTYTFPEGNVLEGWMGTNQENIINGATNNLSNIVEGNPASSHNGIGGSEDHAGSNQTGKTSQLPDNRVDRRRGFRKKPKRSLGERGSIYRGVSRYTGRFEAFLWDNTNPGEKPKTVYVGGFDNEKEAARAYDLAALKLWGEAAPINFSLSDYKKEMEEMQYMTKKEYLLSIRRKSRGFSKGISSYRGVSRNSDYKKWQARLGKGRGMRSIYIGTFGTEEEAARAYDVAAIRMKGLKAVTNFELSNYDVNGILACEKLPIGKGASKVLKKTSVDDFLLTKRNTGKTPTLCSPLENPSSSQPNSQHEQSFEQFNTLATAPNNQIISPYFQQNCNNANQVFHQNLSSSFPLYATQELTQIGGGETSGGNLSESSNLVFPCNGVWGSTA
ncbi:AP2-like ethylene-responsive transcription factor At1g16060 [Juglans microcarpa x Juglans regia]|uniref:AP2-like ethylene-responsive transcription factor At1g16060 n=1 Tax=Juglans microcarpa x Juglans regia TaxID=2249226 RepID=UPI001B7F1A73|nr:AP2-like ethylene-responsive transcription factor At1g16060 [Juglans microcarpa x Juglans regia]